MVDRDDDSGQWKRVSLAKKGIELPISIAAALASSLILYWVIYAYDPWVTSYHLRVSNGLFFVSALLLLPVLFGCKGWGRGHALADWKYWLLFWSVLCGATLLASGRVTGVIHLRLYFAVFYFGLVLRIWFIHANDQVRGATLLGVVFVHAAVLLLVFTALEETGANSGGASLPYHGNIRHVSYHGMVAACLGFSLGILGGRFRLAGYAGSLFALFGIAFFGSRGALLGWLAFVVAAVYLLPDKARTVKLALFFLAVSISSAAVISRYWQSSPYSGSLVDRVQVWDKTGSGRLEIWAQSAQAALAAPLIGYGPDAYRTSRCCPTQFVQPHNSILQVLLEFGLLGLSAAILLVCSSFRQPVAKLMRERSKDRINQFQALLASTMFGFFIFSLVDGLFFHVVPLVVFAIVAALFFARPDPA